MKQSATESLVLWSVLAIVFGVTYGIGSSAETRSNDSSSAVFSTVPDFVYHGPSSDYAVAPDAASLTYSQSGNSRGATRMSSPADATGTTN